MFGCKSICTPGCPATDTVKVDLTAQQLQDAEADTLISAERHRVEETEAAEQEREEKAALQHAAKEAAEGRRREEERKEAAKKAEEERLAQEAAEAAEKAEEEAATKAAAEAAAADAARKAEEERQAEQQSKAATDAFLKEWGFAGPQAPRRKLLKTSYAIHKAAKLGNARVVEQLIKEGADTRQKDSRGKTAAQVAQRHNGKGSHAAVLALLGAPAQPRAGGA